MAQDKNQYNTYSLSDAFTLARFAKMAAKTRRGERITSEEEANFLNLLMNETLSTDNIEQFELFCSAGIIPADMVEATSFAEMALHFSAIKCLDFLFKQDDTLSVKTQLQSTLGAGHSTFLEAAIEQGNIELIDLLITHAKEHHIDYNIKDGIHMALNNLYFLNDTPTSVVERLLQYGFSPYSRDNKNIKYQDEFILKNGDLVFSILAKSIQGGAKDYPVYERLIAHMTDLTEIQNEKNLFEQVVSTGWLTSKKLQAEIFKLLGNKIKILSEKSSLDEIIAKPNFEKDLMSRTYKI